MSRLGKKPIEIPAKVEVTVSGHTFTAKGPKGTLSFTTPETVEVKVENNEILLNPRDSSYQTDALWGTSAAHITNIIEGITKGFEKKLVIEGIGFRGEIKGKTVTLALGFSHPVVVPIPEGLQVTVEKNIITIHGIDRDLVVQFAAEIRLLKKPEPYKGKGIRYDNEVVKRKQGKKSA
jgi:large subunit ribosomal protein L6